MRERERAATIREAVDEISRVWAEWFGGTEPTFTPFDGREPFLGLIHSVPGWKWILRLWRRWFCGRGSHLWVEAGRYNEHVLVCDACGLELVLSGYRAADED